MNIKIEYNSLWLKKIFQFFFNVLISCCKGIIVTILFTGLILFPVLVIMLFGYLIEEVSRYFFIPMAILIFFLVGFGVKFK